MVEKTKVVSSGKINLEGLKKVGKGALIAGGGAVLTYLAEAVPGIDFGAYTAIAVGVFSVAINFFRKLLLKYESKE